MTTYAACFLTYRDATGRKFLIPPGTHCDVLPAQRAVADSQSAAIDDLTADQAVLLAQQQQMVVTEDAIGAGEDQATQHVERLRSLKQRLR